MNALTDTLTDMLGGERYFPFVAGSWGVSALVLLALVLVAWRTHRVRRRRLEILEKGL